MPHYVRNVSQESDNIPKYSTQVLRSSLDKFLVFRIVAFEAVRDKYSSDTHGAFINVLMCESLL